MKFKLMQDKATNASKNMVAVGVDTEDALWAVYGSDDLYRFRRVAEVPPYYSKSHFFSVEGDRFVDEINAWLEFDNKDICDKQWVPESAVRSKNRRETCTL